MLCGSICLVVAENHLESERSVKRGGEEGTLCTPFCRLFLDHNTPPICYAHLNGKTLSFETLRVALLGIIYD